MKGSLRTKYHHADHLSARVTTDTNGTKVGEQGHYPYGESWYSASTTTKWQFTSYEPFGFAQGRRDSESGSDCSPDLLWDAWFSSRAAVASAAGVSATRDFSTSSR